MNAYRVIVADPPWPQQCAGTLRGREGFLDCGGRSAAMPYSTMTIPEIAALTVADLAHPDGAVLWLWTTNGFIRDAFGVLDAWGFRYTHTLTWAKAPMGGGLGRHVGISSEFFLRAVRGRPVVDRKIVGTWHAWKRAYDERGKPQHSAKPAGFYELVEAHSPGPYIELFARRMRMGWDAWGDQAPESIPWVSA